jgi:hypothetical protein
MRWRRLRKWAKWTCTLAAGAAVALAVFSRFYRCGYGATTNSGSTVWHVRVDSGQMLAVRIGGLPNGPLPMPLGWKMWWSPHWYWGYWGEETPYAVEFAWHAGVRYEAHPYGWTFGVSVLHPVALTLIAAALLWYADRRRRGPGSCGGCGYDRAGLAADAKCPECGTIAAK